jgi:hypothetical protein
VAQGVEPLISSECSESSAACGPLYHSGHGSDSVEDPQCIVPQNAAVGDVICVLETRKYGELQSNKRNTVHCILRLQDGNRYSFIGMAYSLETLGLDNPVAHRSSYDNFGITNAYSVEGGSFHEN